MPEVPDVTPGGTIQTAWGNDIRDRAVMRYANAAARDASVLVPVSGDLAWLQDVDELTIYNGSGWEVINSPPAPSAVVVSNTTLTAGVGVNQLITNLTGLNTLKWRYLVIASGNVEAALSGSVAVTWRMAIRVTLPGTTTIHVVEARNYINNSSYRGVLAVSGLTPTPGVGGNAVELVIQRDVTGGTQLLKELSLTAVPVSRNN